MFSAAPHVAAFDSQQFSTTPYRSNRLLLIHDPVPHGLERRLALERRHTTPATTCSDPVPLGLA